MSGMHLIVNGTTHELGVVGHETLLGVLRDRLNLTGTKLSCGRGECGACTVLISRDGATRQSVYACLTLAAACDGASITTIEGLGTERMNALQEAFIAHDAVQCGFCTPGQILAATALLEGNPAPTEGEIARAMSGNLCRCGTYPRILLAVQAAARRIADAG